MCRYVNEKALVHWGLLRQKKKNNKKKALKLSFLNHVTLSTELYSYYQGCTVLARSGMLMLIDAIGGH